ncbi:MAG: triphosphoribosyl-dephospho-CoA synthase [Dongiaceae bacterium]
MRLAADVVAGAYLQACLTELQALKPGNVHVHAAGHGMTVADFEASARASAGFVGQADTGIGACILRAVQATRAVVGSNTNLGILLLSMPLAAASLDDNSGSLRARLAVRLARLDVADAVEAFAAITLAEPGGLGESGDHDVKQPARATLREAMGAARDRDRIARQYVTDFADVFEIGLPRLRQCLVRWGDEAWSAASVHLGFLARFSDTHVARKFGVHRAEAISAMAAPLDAQLLAANDPEMLRPELFAFDALLKTDGINPGTSADLTVATLFARRLEDAMQQHTAA